MKITEVRIFPTKSKDGRLKAYATMTFDDWFVVRNVKIIQGNTGLFVAMPSRKAMDPCPKCGFKNAKGSRFCNDCGNGLKVTVPEDETSKKPLDHMDIAHPIKQECRKYIQDKIIEGYEKDAEKMNKEEQGYKQERPEIRIEEEEKKEEIKEEELSVGEGPIVDKDVLISPEDGEIDIEL